MLHRDAWHGAAIVMEIGAIISLMINFINMLNNNSMLNKRAAPRRLARRDVAAPPAHQVPHARLRNRHQRAPAPAVNEYACVRACCVCVLLVLCVCVLCCVCVCVLCVLFVCVVCMCCVVLCCTFLCFVVCVSVCV